ncbi:MAG TPA: hypothetical protein GX708_01275 [Gallicola sp.]|nr:hypothetical protein [Gallicola sp.]
MENLIKNTNFDYISLKMIEKIANCLNEKSKQELFKNLWKGVRANGN